MIIFQDNESTCALNTEKEQQLLQPQQMTRNFEKNEEKPDEARMEANKRLKEKEDTDEFDIYSKYVASELRNIKDEYSTLIAKKLINNILIDARIGKYRKNTSADFS